MAHSLYESQLHFFALYHGEGGTYQDCLEVSNTTITVLDKIGSKLMRTDNYLVDLRLKGNSNTTNPMLIEKSQRLVTEDTLH